MPGSAPPSRSRRRPSTAMSASLTGEEAPLIQFFSGVPNMDSASRPASRTEAPSTSTARAVSSASMAGNGETLYAQRRRVGAVAEDEIVGRFEALEYFQQVSGDGHFADRISQLAVL